MIVLLQTQRVGECEICRLDDIGVRQHLQHRKSLRVRLAERLPFALRLLLHEPLLHLLPQVLLLYMQMLLPLHILLRLLGLLRVLLVLSSLLLLLLPLLHAHSMHGLLPLQQLLLRGRLRQQLPLAVTKMFTLWHTLVKL